MKVEVKDGRRIGFYLPMYCIDVVHNGGGVNCGEGGHPLRRVYCCAFLGSILGAFKVYHRQNHINSNHCVKC